MPLTKERLSPWIVLPVCASILLAGLDLGDRFWGSASDSRVTSYQVSQLTSAVRDLASKFDAMAKQSSVDALSARVDRHDGQIGDLNTEFAGLRADVNNLAHPPIRIPR